MFKKLILTGLSVLLIAGNAWAAWPSETLWYKMNDNAADANVVDSSSNGFTGTATANTDTKSVSAKINTGLSFNGSSDRIGKAHETALNVGAGAWSLSLWLNAPNSDQLAEFLQKRNGAGLTPGIQAGIGSITVSPAGKKIYGLHRQDNSNTKTYVTTNDVIDGNPHHVVVVYTGSAFVFYIDGSSVAVTTFADLGTPNANVSDSFYIGWQNNNRWLNASYIDDYRFFVGSALTQAQVTALYNSGNGTESSLASLESVASRRVFLISNSARLAEEPVYA